MDGRNEQRVAIKNVSEPVYLQQKHKYLCKRLMGMRLCTNQMFLGGILDFETEGSW
jgi:hypothetical protein